MKHPNAYVAAVTTVAGTAATNIADRLGYDLSPTYRDLLVGGLITGLLFVGRRGIKGTLVAVWRGGLLVWNGSDAPAAAAERADAPKEREPRVAEPTA